MKKRFPGSVFTLAVILGSLSPALANITDISVKATLQDIMSLQIETQQGGQIVSSDDVDPSGSFLVNEVLDFGLVNPKGLETTAGAGHNLAVNRQGASNNATVFNVQSMVIDSSNFLYDPVETASHPLPHQTGLNYGALYFSENAVQLRSLRTGAGNMDVDIYNYGDFDAVVTKPTNFTYKAVNFTDKIASRDLDVTTPDIDYSVSGLTLQNDTPQPIALGIIVPFSMNSSGGTNKNTLITFKGQ
jgi:hypothetical protein